MSVKMAVRMKELREKAGLTQDNLAAAAGVRLGTLRSIEQGANLPTWTTLRRLAVALEVSLSAFDGLEDEEPTPRTKKAKGSKRK